MELKDKVIAITGGASGLGEASTRHFVSQGAKVMILDTVSYTHLTLPTINWV